jgi:hypothetical protein
LALCSDFAQSNPGKLRVSEHAVWNQPVASATVASSKVIPDDSEIVYRGVRELRATGALPDCPDTGRSRLQPIINANVPAFVQVNAGQFKSDIGGVGNTSCRDEYVAAFDLLIAG